MGKKPFQIGSGTGEPLSGTARTTLAELEVEGLGSFPVERVATIGRSPDSHIALNVRSVSRHHARIFYEGGHFWVKDLGSGNGTTVNGKKVSLQMLSDQDKLCFGEASAIFHSATRVPGPAPLAHDPLEGSDRAPQDGTPTGGLKGVYPHIHPVAGRPDSTWEGPAPQPPPEDNAGLRAQIQSLQRENLSLRNEIAELRTAGLVRENEKLKKLVVQLERALADSNIRIRNLQKRLEE